MTLIAPSILASDWTKLGQEIQAVENAGADWIHLDVMDGQFVPPITFGPQLVSAARRVTTLPLDVHLMITQPEKQIQPFADAGADIVTVHAEACSDLPKTIELIHKAGVKAGVSIKPATSVDSIKDIIPEIDLFLVMSVEPGWGGQSFIPESIEKIKQVKKLIEQTGKNIHLEVDGGINEVTAKETTTSGADVLVAGSYIFKHGSYTTAIANLR